VQPVIGHSLPFWPLGLPKFDDQIVAYGLKAPDYSLVSVWARNVGENARTALLGIPQYAGVDVEITPIFPLGNGFEPWNTSWDLHAGECAITVPEGEYASRTFMIAAKHK
jgi:alpha-galactosidase